MTLGAGPDHELLTATRADDAQAEQAFAILYHRHAPLVRGVCRRTLGSGDPWVDDAVQAVFLILRRRSAAVRDPSRLPGFLHTTAVHVCRRICRERRRRSRREVLAHRPPTSSEGEAPELLDQLDDAIARLSAAQRAAVVAHYLEAKSQAEVAAGLGISVDAVKQRLRAGLEALRQRLGPGVAGALLLPELLDAGTIQPFAPSTTARGLAAQHGPLAWVPSGTALLGGAVLLAALAAVAARPVGNATAPVPLLPASEPAVVAGTTNDVPPAPPAPFTLFGERDSLRTATAPGWLALWSTSARQAWVCRDATGFPLVWRIPGAVRDLAFSPDGLHIAWIAGGGPVGLIVRATLDGQEVPERTLELPAGASALAFSGKDALVIGVPGGLLRVDLGKMPLVAVPLAGSRSDAAQQEGRNGQAGVEQLEQGGEVGVHVELHPTGRVTAPPPPWRLVGGDPVLAWDGIGGRLLSASTAAAALVGDTAHALPFVPQTTAPHSGAKPASASGRPLIATTEHGMDLGWQTAGTTSATAWHVALQRTEVERSAWALVGSTLVQATDSGLHRTDLATGQSADSVLGRCLSLAPLGADELLVVGAQELLRVRAADGVVRERVALATAVGAWDALATPDARHLAGAGRDGRLQLWDLVGAQRLGARPGEPLPAAPSAVTTRLAASNGRLIVASGRSELEASGSFVITTFGGDRRQVARLIGLRQPMLWHTTWQLHDFALSTGTVRELADPPRSFWHWSWDFALNERWCAVLDTTSLTLMPLAGGTPRRIPLKSLGVPSGPTDSKPHHPLMEQADRSNAFFLTRLVLSPGSDLLLIDCARGSYLLDCRTGEPAAGTPRNRIDEAGLSPDGHWLVVSDHQRCYLIALPEGMPLTNCPPAVDAQWDATGARYVMRTADRFLVAVLPAALHDGGPKTLEARAALAKQLSIPCQLPLEGLAQRSEDGAMQPSMAGVPRPLVGGCWLLPGGRLLALGLPDRCQLFDTDSGDEVASLHDLGDAWAITCPDGLAAGSPGVLAHLPRMVGEPRLHEDRAALGKRLAALLPAGTAALPVLHLAPAAAPAGF